MEDDWSVLLEIGYSLFSGGCGVEAVSFGFRVVDMVDVRSVKHCT